ncbi:MAG: DnaJ domain-containing protein [Candidatus Acidiferrales bacterium]
MSIPEERIAGLKHAYQVLGVPLSATPASIKQSYRRLAKRWHPDLYESDAVEHADATRMTKAINESYSLIENAPLRYFVDAFRPGYAAARQTVRPVARPVPEAAPPKDAGGRAQEVREYPRVESILKYTWAEFWIRFVCGGIFGAMCGFRIGVRYYTSPGSFVAGMVAGAVIVAFVAVVVADGFWQWFLGRWWIWR